MSSKDYYGGGGGFYPPQGTLAFSLSGAPCPPRLTVICVCRSPSGPRRILSSRARTSVSRRTPSSALWSATLWATSLRWPALRRAAIWWTIPTSAPTSASGGLCVGVAIVCQTGLVRFTSSPTSQEEKRRGGGGEGCLAVLAGMCLCCCAEGRPFPSRFGNPGY